MNKKIATSEVTWALLTEGVSAARLEVHRLNHLCTRVLALVEKSDAKEHLYEVAGDIIQAVPTRMEALGRNLDRTSYALSKIGESHLRSRLPLSDRQQVEEAVVSTRSMSKTLSAARVALRWQKKQGDLNPQLGWPGGPCHVLNRIQDEIPEGRLRDELMGDVEQGLKLDNSQANKIYDLEMERGAGSFKKMMITPHAQYRMDQRNVTVFDLRFALGQFTKQYLAGKQLFRQQVKKQKSVALREFALQTRRDIARREPLQFVDPHKLVVVFISDGPVARIITTYWQGKSDPKPQQVETCPINNS